MTRVLLVTSSLHGGGAEFVARTWIDWLTQRGAATAVALLSDTKGRDDLDPRIAVHDDAAGQRPAEAVRSLRRVIDRVRPSVVLSLQTHPNLWALAAVASIPSASRPAVVISERNLVSLGLAGSSPTHRAKVLAAKASYRRADRVIAISHPVAGELVSAFGVTGRRCVVVPNPATAKVTVRHEPWIAERPVLRLVLPARIVEQKRPLLAVHVASVLARRGYDVELITFGTGPQEAAMTRLAGEVGVRLSHRGWVEAWFDAAPRDAIVLLPSLREGFGNVLVEAAAVGLPAVAVSGALGVADAVVPGVTGQLALDDDPESIADAVLAAAPLRVRGIDGWLERFSVPTSGALLERVLAGAEAERRANR
ncbi:hypothetical protein C8046_16080 [Serinibacter arcticus]|uniref:Glycosyltransferase subfamily 4-like N-terminal domain-containing protein n=1 Tax=Serinibacter arcticus TaxID=1655435 RepID=A0A2U1ZY69_9MICO|nr:glycosyltransferase [Serinibacter arcticus]PWD51938.1 hypothetical protein C8046_16080 [Serinibacter arcticus]